MVDADLGLSGGDLRAAERTFQLLHQVSGRAGRADLAGLVLIQTYDPNRPVMQALKAGDRDRFYALEAEERRLAGMPPFGRLAAVILSGGDPDEVDRLGQHLARTAPHQDGVQVLGPAPAPLALAARASSPAIPGQERAAMYRASDGAARTGCRRRQDARRSGARRSISTLTVLCNAAMCK